jgi:hypothetical protein
VDYFHNVTLFSHKEEWNYVICKKANGASYHHVKKNKLDWEIKIIPLHECRSKKMQNLDLKIIIKIIICLGYKHKCVNGGL